MNSENENPFRTIGATVTALRIIAGALTLGIVSFGVVSLFVEMEPRESAKMALLVAAFSATCVGTILCFYLGGAHLEQTIEKMQDQPMSKRVGRIVGTRIMGLAMLEGPGILWVVSSMLLQNPFYLAGAALTVVLMASQFPNVAYMEGLLQAEAAEIDAALDSERSP